MTMIFHTRASTTESRVSLHIYHSADSISPAPVHCPITVMNTVPMEMPMQATRDQKVWPVVFAAFTLMILFLSKEPIRTLYNYPPNIQERVKTPEEYKGRITTQKNKAAVKCSACVLFVIVISLILRYVNGYTTFIEAFGYGFLLWIILNLYDVIVLDILWFCHDPRFVFHGTEDMVKDYHDYGFHINGFFIGEALALAVCAPAGLTVQFILR